PHWKSQLRLHPGNFEIASRQWEYGTGCDGLRRRDPTIAAIVRCGAVTVNAVRNRGPLARSFGVNFHPVLVEIVVSLKISAGDKARKSGKPLNTTDCLDVIVENLSGRRCAFKVPLNFVGDSQDRLGVLLR